MSWSVGAATLPKSGQTVPGDAAWVWSNDDKVRVVVVDGVGHGLRASFVLQKIQKSNVLQVNTDMAVLLSRMNTVLSGTIGAVCLIVDLFEGSEFVHLEYAGVGNVRFWTQSTVGKALEGRPGVLGQRFPRRIDVQHIPLDKGERIFIATDGVRTAAERQSRHLPLECNSMVHVHSLLHDHHNPSDDGTLVVICHTSEKS